jgi:hypothetical protein
MGANSLQGRMDEMSRFYGESLGLKQVTKEKGRREFAAAEPESRYIRDGRRRAARGRGLCFISGMSVRFARRWRLVTGCGLMAIDPAPLSTAAVAAVSNRRSGCPT